MKRKKGNEKISRAKQSAFSCRQSNWLPRTENKKKKIQQTCSKDSDVVRLAFVPFFSIDACEALLSLFSATLFAAILILQMGLFAVDFFDCEFVRVFLGGGAGKTKKKTVAARHPS